MNLKRFRFEKYRSFTTLSILIQIMQKDSFLLKMIKIVKMFKAVDHPYNMFIGFTHGKIQCYQKNNQNATSKLGPINYFDIDVDVLMIGKYG